MQIQRVIALLLALALAGPATIASVAEPSTQPQRGYLDDGALQSGTLKNWHEAVDTLARMGFTYVAGSEADAIPEVKTHLAQRGIQWRVIGILDDSSSPEGTPNESTTNGSVVLPSALRARWIAGLLTAPPGQRVLWGDDGQGAISAWPPEPDEQIAGVMLHAGRASNVPVIDPYPARLGDTLSAAAARGLAADVLVAAPGFWPFLLNLEAVAAAHDDPAAFQADRLYAEWTATRFGDTASADTVKAMKLLHGAQEQSAGFTAVVGRSMALLEGLEKGEPAAAGPGPTRQALDYAQRAAALAAETLNRLAGGAATRYQGEVVQPLSMYADGLELLASMTALASASRIQQDFPESPLPRQRLVQAIEQAAQTARDLQATTANLPGSAGVMLPTPERIEALGARLADG